MTEHIKLRDTNNSSTGRIALLTFIYFFYIYSFHIPGFPSGILYYRVALGLLFVYTCMSSGLKAINFGSTITSKSVKKYLLWNLFLLLYVGFILMTFGKGNGLSALPSYVNMLIILPLFFISGKYIFRSVNELMSVLYIGCVIQAVIIILATFNPALEAALKYLYLGSVPDVETLDAIERMTSKGYHMGFQCFTSQGSLMIALGEIGAVFYLMKSNGPKFILHLAAFIFISFASSLLSRTGLFVSVSCLFVVFINKWGKGTKGFFAGFLILIISYLVLSYIIGNFSSNAYLSENFNRFGSNDFIESYFKEWTGEGVGDNVVPPLSVYTLLGLGIRQGTSGVGIQTVVDGGFLINYSSMGLIMAVINYLIIFSFFLKQFRHSNNSIHRSLIIILSLILIMGEIKEHFIYQFYFMSFLFVIFALMEKDELKARVF